MNAIAANLFAVMTVAMVKFDDRKNNDKGAAMVEYALLVAGMAVVVGLAVGFFGTEIQRFIKGITLTASSGGTSPS